MLEVFAASVYADRWDGPDCTAAVIGFESCRYENRRGQFNEKGAAVGLPLSAFPLIRPYDGDGAATGPKTGVSPRVHPLPLPPSA